MNLVGARPHTPWREVIGRAVLHRVRGPRGPRRPRHRPVTPAASPALQGLDGHGRGRSTPAVPDVPALAAPSDPPRTDPRPRRGLSLPWARENRALAKAHGLEYGRLSISEIWCCKVCRSAGFGTGRTAAADHARHVATRQAAAEASR